MRNQMVRIRWIAWIVLGMLACGCLFAAPCAARDKVAYRLKWLINASTAGDVFADERGFFRQEGLEVEVKAGGPERDAIRELELGYAQFGVASADQVIRALDKGAHVVVVAQLFQKNPLQWIYRANQPPIKTIKDLTGRTVGITYGGNDETIMRALLASAGLDEKAVQLASVRYDYTPFYKGEVAVWPVYRNTQGIYLSDKLAEGGEKVRFFDPEAHGIKFVANSVVTSQKMIETQPQVVARFTRALLAGWRASMDPANEDEVIRALSAYDKDTGEVVMRRQLAVTREMVVPTDPNIPLGQIDTSAWQQTEDIMVAQKLVGEPVKVVSRLKTQ